MPHTVVSQCAVKVIYHFDPKTLELHMLVEGRHILLAKNGSWVVAAVVQHIPKWVKRYQIQQQKWE